jgi:chitin disaccharide deacetylase
VNGANNNPRRWLIVNADDFGLTEGTNRGIIRAHESGIVTSTSLMVRGAAAADAARYAIDHPRLSVGLHVDLSEWVYRQGEWAPRYEVVPPDDRDAVADELARQLAAFHRLLGRPPTHIDSHQHIHRNEPARSVVAETAARLSIAARGLTPHVQYCGDFYGQTGEGEPYPEGITLEGLLTTIRKLPAGLTELGCHPGDDGNLDSVYRSERLQELRVLCDPQVRAALEANQVQLCSFLDVPRLLSAMP